ncbi:hypothetical protein QEG_2389, partial [Clostridioides difficile CD127]
MLISIIDLVLIPKELNKYIHSNTPVAIKINPKNVENESTLNFVV